MNTNRSTLKTAIRMAAAAAAMIAGSAMLQAQSPVLKASVPFDFVANGKMAKAGDYEVTVKHPGVVLIQTAKGLPMAIAMLPVQTSSTTNKSTLTLVKANGEYRLGGYCMLGAGCWSSYRPASGSTTDRDRIELTLLSAPRR